MRSGFLLSFLGLLTVSGSTFGLQPDQVALVVNAKVPSGVELAKHYARQRSIPDGRIIVLNLPADKDIPADQYDRYVVPAVRQFLQDNHLEKKVTCLVTFYGLPLRVAAKVNTAVESSELKQIQAEEAAAIGQIEQHTKTLEQLAAQLDKSFKAESGKDRDALNKRLVAALKVINPSSIDASNGNHDEYVKTYLQTMELLHGPAIRLLRAGSIPPDRLPPELKDLSKRLQQAQQQVTQLEQRSYDSDARKQLRQIVNQNFGLISLARLLHAQQSYFDTAATESALDSELSLLWWDYYSRIRWQPNLLNWHVKTNGAPPTLMVMRLDGPDQQTVWNMIDTSIQVEKDGLKGSVVVDAGGAKKLGSQNKNDPYWTFDNSLLHLAAMVRQKTKLQVKLDENAEVLPANSTDDVAIYCGWYSVHHYIPCCKFNPGAVGYHVASFELSDLHDRRDTGWVRGLLKDGVVGSLGPVGEPYLHAFPPPDEFFPLLLTGKLTLAEVYWKTTPMTSWKIAAIGDPLYTPYRKNPPMARQDLPDGLRQAVDLTQANPPSGR